MIIQILNVWHAQNALNHVSNDWFYHYVRASECVFLKIQKKNIWHCVFIFKSNLKLMWICMFVCLFGAICSYECIWVCVRLYTHTTHMLEIVRTNIYGARKTEKSSILLVKWYWWWIMKICFFQMKFCKRMSIFKTCQTYANRFAYEIRCT